MIDLSPVVVTGLGTVNATGCGRRASSDALSDSQTHWSIVDRSAGFHRRRGSRLAGLTAGVDLSPWLAPAMARRMSQPSRLAVAAAKMALADAGLELDGSEEPPTAVVVSNAHGPNSILEKILFQQLRQGPLAVSPALFTESVANAPAAQVAIACRARGPNLTVIQRDAGALIAVTQAAAEIVAGRVSRAVVIAVDELTPLLHAVLDRFNMLATDDDKGEETARPFDRRRTGAIAAEGSTALVLEPEAAVRDRGGKVLARLRSGASAFDPRSPRSGWSNDPRTLAGACRRYLDKTGSRPEDFGAVVSGTAGTFGGDRLEAGVLRAVWGECRLPPVLVPKAVLGDHGGGLLAGMVLAIEGAAFGPTPGFAEADPDLGVIPHDGRPFEPPAKLLATAVAAGGAAAWLVLEKEHER
ncbi:MAG: beta-ketoacyl synthase N-terminal-like domain-containing protein [Thermoanaerobaculia bacterium]